jgi:zinc D-Ala-D-Ala carboxypeptidase
MYLSQHFTIDEFTQSQTAAREGIDNSIPADLMPSAKRTANGLELVRTLLNSHSVLVSSGYRCPALNAKVGGSKASQHMLCEAADFTCPTYGTPAQIVSAITKSTIPYDQCILEYFDPIRKTGWVHISFTDKPRKQALVIDQSGTRSYTA